jgi:beta-lactam-binding protein with PASTA domain
MRAPGIILQQSPEPGTDISKPLQMEFVVSKGQEDISITVPAFTGLSIPAALERVGTSGINFSFLLRAVQGREKFETVVSQDPIANSVINSNSIVYLTVTPPSKLLNDEIFKLFRYTIPPNPYPLAVQLDVLYLSGEQAQIIKTDYPGGEFIVPCKIPAGSILILSMMNREIYRETVNHQPDSLSFEQL